MSNLKIREAKVGDAEALAVILREIGWSEKRNALPLEEISGPIERLIQHVNEDREGHTTFVAVDENDAASAPCSRFERSNRLLRSLRWPNPRRHRLNRAVGEHDTNDSFTPARGRGGASAIVGVETGPDQR